MNLAVRGALVESFGSVAADASLRFDVRLQGGPANAITLGS